MSATFSLHFVKRFAVYVCLCVPVCVCARARGCVCVCASEQRMNGNWKEYAKQPRMNAVLSQAERTAFCTLNLSRYCTLNLEQRTAHHA